MGKAKKCCGACKQGEWMTPEDAKRLKSWMGGKLKKVDDLVAAIRIIQVMVAALFKKRAAIETQLIAAMKKAGTNHVVTPAIGEALRFLTTEIDWREAEALNVIKGCDKKTRKWLTQLRLNVSAANASITQKRHKGIGLVDSRLQTSLRKCCTMKRAWRLKVGPVTKTTMDAK